MNNTMVSFAHALECRLSSEYNRSGYRGSFQDFCDSRMPEILDVMVPSVLLYSGEPHSSYDPVKEAFEDWFHNKFKYDDSDKKTYMLRAWKAAQEVYHL